MTHSVASTLHNRLTRMNHGGKSPSQSTLYRGSVGMLVNRGRNDPQIRVATVQCSSGSLVRFPSQVDCSSNVYSITFDDYEKGRQIHTDQRESFID